MRKIKFYPQEQQMDCGPTCLRMICHFYGLILPIQKLRALCQISDSGVSLQSLSEAAEDIGFETNGARVSLRQLKKEILPCIVHWKNNHFVVLHQIKNSNYHIADPTSGMIELGEEEFKLKCNADDRILVSTCLFLKPASRLNEQKLNNYKILNWKALLSYLRSDKWFFLQILISLIAGTAVQSLIPVLTQKVIDIGINTQDISLIYILLSAQFGLVIGFMSLNFLRSWILLHVTSRLGIRLLTEYITRVINLPIAYFEKKTAGDFMQRVQDEQRIENFLTNTSLNTLLSLFTFIVFSVILYFYNLTIFFVSIIGSVLYSVVLLLTLKQRRELNKQQFSSSSENQTALLELLNGIHEIKLYDISNSSRKLWEQTQVSLYQQKKKGLFIHQFQQFIITFLNQAKLIFITFFCVKAIIDGQMTIGEMLAVQYLTGQVNSPIEQLLLFSQSYQDMKISLERLNEIFSEKGEIEWEHDVLVPTPSSGIEIRAVDFKYKAEGEHRVFTDLSLSIPAGKVTAIVGSSGSGKSSLLKLLLGFVEPDAGEIKIGLIPGTKLNLKQWRKMCGCVLQNGFIFAGTIEQNIALTDGEVNADRLNEAIKTAHLRSVISAFPNGLQTRVGCSGVGLSQGQRQRILIARAVYKNPPYLFMDEATSALDATTERLITNNLKVFFKGKTVVTIAHRLNTIREADNIIVLDDGAVVEQGTHQELILLGGRYYEMLDTGAVVKV